jgi:methyl-accepting chemotaxis protein
MGMYNAVLDSRTVTTAVGHLTDPAEFILIKAALDAASSNLMIADADGTILHANRAVLALLHRAERDIQRELPHFCSSRLIGCNMGVFHRNPAHQQQLLQRLTQPFEADIRVGTRRFRLIASPIAGADGKRLGTVVEWQDRTDELRMQEAVAAAIQAAIDGELDCRIDHHGYSDFLARMADGINQLLATFDQVLDDAGASLAALARGDLSRRIETPYRGRYEGLKQDINDTIARLQQVVDGICHTTTAVQHSAQEISSGNLALSQRTEEQAGSLEQTAAAMGNITSRVEQNSQSARIARELTQDARAMADNGGAVLARSVAAMQGISESSSRIEDIIQVIDEIALQTNLLSLNAAVEAARAGDSGRGFAVVASEVRNLAGRSAKAAKEIKALIGTSALRVREGASLVEESGQTLERIIAAIGKAHAVVTEIADNSAEQAVALRQINRAVQQMDEMTQHNAALVEEAANAADSLHEQAAALGQLVAFFAARQRGR